MPVFFYVSAIAAGCAMVIFESVLSSRISKRGLEIGLLSEIARVAVFILAVLFTMKVVDLIDRDAAGLLFVLRPETFYYWGEVLVGIIAPFVLLALPRVRASKNGLFAGAVLIVIGFVLNRMNVSMTALQGSWQNGSYFPSWMEVAISLAIVTVGFIVFATIAKFFPVFTNPEIEEAPSSVGEWELDLANASKVNTGDHHYEIEV
jgi:Ni/Fe-hydrogenase subunit HybB-like protein